MFPRKEEFEHKNSGRKKLTIAVEFISTAYIHAAATAFGGGNSSYVLFDVLPTMLTAGAFKKKNVTEQAKSQIKFAKRVWTERANYAN